MLLGVTVRMSKMSSLSLLDKFAMDHTALHMETNVHNHLDFLPQNRVQVCCHVSAWYAASIEDTFSALTAKVATLLALSVKADWKWSAFNGSVGFLEDGVSSCGLRWAASDSIGGRWRMLSFSMPSKSREAAHGCCWRVGPSIRPHPAAQGRTGAPVLLPSWSGVISCFSNRIWRSLLTMPISPFSPWPIHVWKWNA